MSKSFKYNAENILKVEKVIDDKLKSFIDKLTLGPVSKPKDNGKKKTLKNCARINTYYGDHDSEKVRAFYIAIRDVEFYVPENGGRSELELRCSWPNHVENLDTYREILDMVSEKMKTKVTKKHLSDANCKVDESQWKLNLYKREDGKEYTYLRVKAWNLDSDECTTKFFYGKEHKRVKFLDIFNEKNNNKRRFMGSIIVRPQITFSNHGVHSKMAIQEVNIVKSVERISLENMNRAVELGLVSKDEYDEDEFDIGESYEEADNNDTEEDVLEIDEVVSKKTSKKESVSDDEDESVVSKKKSTKKVVSKKNVKDDDDDDDDEQISKKKSGASRKVDLLSDDDDD